MKRELATKEVEITNINRTIQEMLDLSEANEHHLQETKTSFMLKLT